MGSKYTNFHKAFASSAEIVILWSGVAKIRQRKDNALNERAQPSRWCSRMTPKSLHPLNDVKQIGEHADMMRPFVSIHRCGLQLRRIDIHIHCKQKMHVCACECQDLNRGPCHPLDSLARQLGPEGQYWTFYG